jgi:hypothetical protein
VSKERRRFLNEKVGEIVEVSEETWAGGFGAVRHTPVTRRRLSGLAAEDFKLDPQGHSGGSLNITTAYAGYRAASTLLFLNRSSWAHSLEAVAWVTGIPTEELLVPAGIDVLDGRRSPAGVTLEARSGDGA